MSLQRLVFVVLLSLSLPVSAQRARGRGRAPQEFPESAPATQPAAQPQEKKDAADHLSVTEGSVALASGGLNYRSTAGTLAIKDESGKLKAEMFFVAYEKLPDENRADRPITFVFNGGPGAAAVWLHLGAAGPKRVELSELGDRPAPPYRLVDNKETWLAATDLVFIDPVGTGYSRPAPGEKPEQFFGVEEDVQSVGGFIQLYLTRYDRWLSPKFLAGESYGTFRAAALSDYLMNNGIGLNGIVLISSVLSFQTIDAGGGNDLPYVLYLPTYTALAWYHHKLPADLQSSRGKALAESERWATHEYLTDLAAGNQLAADQRKGAVSELARLTGLPESYVERANLRIEPGEFRKQLLADQHKVLGRYDGRLTGYDSDPTAQDPQYDPSFAPFLDAYSATFNNYARTVLKYDSDLKYEALSGRVRPWNFGQRGNGYVDVATRLNSSLVQSPNLKVLFASGIFDLATPYLAAKYTIGHLEIAPDVRGNVNQSFYEAGHMVYHHAADREKLTHDVTALIDSALPHKTAAAKTE